MKWEVHNKCSCSRTWKVKGNCLIAMQEVLALGSQNSIKNNKSAAVYNSIQRTQKTLQFQANNQIIKIIWYCLSQNGPTTHKILTPLQTYTTAQLSPFLLKIQHSPLNFYKTNNNSTSQQTDYYDQHPSKGFYNYNMKLFPISPQSYKAA